MATSLSFLRINIQEMFPDFLKILFTLSGFIVRDPGVEPLELKGLSLEAKGNKWAKCLLTASVSSFHWLKD